MPDAGTGFKPLPLLSSYKHGLARRRLLSTLTGGVQLQRVPWPLHLLQLSLWLSPLLLSLPFVVLEALSIWNRYLLALIYACMMVGGVSVVRVVEVCGGYWSRKKTAPSTSLGRVSRSSREVRPDGFSDEEGFDTSTIGCCKQHSFKFLFGQRSIHSRLLHPLLSGVLCYGGCFMLFVGVMREVMHVSAVVVVFVCGWYTLCSAHYALVAGTPHETAIYRHGDPLELRLLARAVCVVVVTAVFIALRLLLSQPSLYLQLLYAALSLFPLGWALGLLPPLDALLPWLAEQVLVRLLGGSPLATDLRLLVMFSLSAIAAAIVAPLSDRALAVLLASAFGFLLSQDIFTNLKALVSPLFTKCSSLSGTLKTSCSSVFSDSYLVFFTLWFRPLSSIKYYLVALCFGVPAGLFLLGSSLVILNFTFNTRDSSQRLAKTVTGGVIVGLCVFVRLSNALQGVYLLRLFRNPLYPHWCSNVVKFRARRKILAIFSAPRRIILDYVAPLLLTAYVGLGLESDHTMTPSVWFGIAAARILRKVWQSTSSALLELAVVAVIDLVVPADSSWAALGLGLQALVIGLSLDITSQFLNKLSFALSLWISFIYYKKQRTFTPLTIMIILGMPLLLPLVLFILLLSAVLSTPLLPLFTLPVFLPSFPRTMRFWPSLITYGDSSSCTDSVYYQQVQSELAKLLSQSISTGAVSVSPGSYLLVRFQDRLVFISVLEVGSGYCVVHYRGLELQETSCHSVEATQVDTMFESAFNPESNSRLQFWFNQHTLSILQPVEAAVIRTYSDAHNVLTGIIDQPIMLERFSSNLLKCLVWVFYHHLHSTVAACSGSASDDFDLNSHVDAAKVGDEATRKGLDSGLEQSPLAEQHSVADSTFEADWSGDLTRGAVTPCHITTQTRFKELENLSWSESVWSLANDTPEPLPAPQKPPHCDDHLLASLPGCIQDTLLASPNTRTDTHCHNPSRTMSNGVTEAHVQSEMRLSEVIQPPQLAGPAASYVAPPDSRRPHPHRSGTFPDAWTRLPVTQSQLTALADSFPREWLELIKSSPPSSNCTSQQPPLPNNHQLPPSLNHKAPSASFNGAGADQQLSDLVLACFCLVDVPACQLWCGTACTKPSDVYAGFCGDFPHSTHRQWLESDSQLYGLTLKAYRYAVWLMLNEGSLGVCETEAELAEYLQTYDSDCFVGREDEPGWRESVLTETPSLLSIGRDPETDTYTAHVLTLQEQVAHMGSLNSEAVRATWADLCFELFYLTNDDDERYSIQAHSLLLRNLTTQAADPPLGYPVYSSGLLRVPCTL